MNVRTSRRFLAFTPIGKTWSLQLAVAAAVFLAATSSIAGTSGTWINPNPGGVWSNSANWLGGTIANGADATANFSTLNITADDVVHLDSIRTIGALVFADLTPTNNWVIDNNANPANTLTLAVTAGTPTITILNQSATISAGLGGTQGLTFLGAGPDSLTLSGANALSGGISATAGTLTLDYTSQNNNKFSSSSSLTLSGATLGVIGNASAMTQSMSGLSLGANSSCAIIDNSGATSLSLSGIARSVGATVDFNVGGAAQISTTTINAAFSGGANTILGGWATFGGGSTWAVAGSSGAATNISGLAAFVGNFTSAADVDASGVYAINSTTVNSVRFNSNSGATTVNIASGNTLTVATGGILETTHVAANSIQFTGGSLTSGNGTDLIISQFNTNATMTINSLITGSNVALVKNGGGVLALTNTANSFSGGLVITAGTLSFATSNQLSSGPVTLNGGVLLWNNKNTASTFQNTLNLGANGGVVSVSANNNFVFQLTSIVKDAPGQHGSVTIPSGSSVEFEGGNVSYSGTTFINGELLVEAGLGDKIAPASPLVIGSAGLLEISADSNYNNITFAIASLSGGGVIACDNSTETIAIGTNNANTTFTGSIGGAGTFSSRGSFTKVGSGTLTLTGPSTYTGATTIKSGTLAVGGNAAVFGQTTGVTLGDTVGSADASIVLAGPYTLNYPVVIQSGSTGIMTIGGATANSSTVAGQITLNQPVNLSQVAGGTLNVTGGILAFGNTVSTVGAGNITIKTNGIVGSGAALNLNGTGNVILDVGLTETYGGPTNVNSGTLVVNGVLDSETSAVTVHSGATLKGTGTINRPTFISANGQLAPGNSVGTLTISVLQLATNSILGYEFNLTANDFVNTTSSGGLTINGGGFFLYQEGTTSAFTTLGTYHLLGYVGSFQGAGPTSLSVLNPQSGLTYTFSNNTALRDIDLTIGAVPEPPTIVLVSLGIATACTVIVGRQRRRPKVAPRRFHRLPPIR